MFVGSCVVRVLLPVVLLYGLDGEKPTPGRDRIHYLGLKIVPNPVYDKNEYTKKEVGGRGGAYKYKYIYIYI